MSDLFPVVCILIGWIAFHECLIIRERKLKDAQTKDLLDRLMARTYGEYSKGQEAVKVVAVEDLKKEIQADYDRDIPIS